jgi:pyruvate dehydrogenase E1 component alpha subunit
VYTVASEAVARARRGEGPTLIEAKTHRRGGHAEGEIAFLAGQNYRLPEEVAAAEANDPLIKLHSYMVEQGIAPAEQLETLDQDITAQVQAAVEFARNAPEPEIASIYEDTWV